MRTYKLLELERREDKKREEHRLYGMLQVLDGVLPYKRVMDDSGTERLFALLVDGRRTQFLHKRVEICCRQCGLSILNVSDANEDMAKAAMRGELSGQVVEKAPASLHTIYGDI